MMRIIKPLVASLIVVGLALPSTAIADAADASDVPGSATWYFHVNLERMKSEDAGKGVYDWLRTEVFNDVAEDAGIDIENELDRLTAYSLPGEGPVIVVNGDISQATKDKLMTLIAAEGDLAPLKSSGKSYYRVRGDDKDSGDDEAKPRRGDISIHFDSLGDEAWISMDVKNAVIVAASEAQMKALLANNGRIAGARGHKDALIVLSAEKALLQAGMNSDALGDDGDSDWNSNILRNTEQVAILIAAVADKLLIEAKLVTTEAAMAESLASVARGLLSLLAFDDDMDAEIIAVLRGTKIEASGNSLNISLAVDPALVVATLGD